MIAQTAQLRLTVAPRREGRQTEIRAVRARSGGARTASGRGRSDGGAVSVPEIGARRPGSGREEVDRLGGGDRLHVLGVEVEHANARHQLLLELGVVEL